MAGAGPVLTLMGDLNVELSTRLDGVTFASLARDRLEYGTIAISIGGTAANLAHAAAGEFGQVNVLARVGGDAFGRLVLDELARAGVRTLLAPKESSPTGVAIYVRDGSVRPSKGVRLLIIERGANRLIRPGDVEEHAPAIAESDVFFLDGYCFLEEPRLSASRRAMTLAGEGGVPVALDLVPHDIHRFLSSREAAAFIEMANIVIVEVRTIRRVLGLPSPDEVRDPAAAYDTWAVLERTFPNRYFELRFGIGNADESLHCRPGEQPELRANGYVDSSDPRGFGDRLTAAQLVSMAAAFDSRPQELRESRRADSNRGPLHYE